MHVEFQDGRREKWVANNGMKKLRNLKKKGRVICIPIRARVRGDLGGIDQLRYEMNDQEVYEKSKHRGS